MVPSGRSDASQCGITIAYQRHGPNQIHHVFDMCRPLPNLTGSCAHDAKPIGGFGLVRPLFTGAYHSRDLSRSRPGIAFTKHHRLVIAIGIIDCYNELDVLTVVGYEMIPIYFALGIGRVVTGLCE